MAEVSWSASQDADPLLSIGSVGGSEDVGSLEFTVDLSPASLQTVTVGYATADGTASAGTDYTEQSGGRLTFAPGTTVRTIAVAIAADDVDEEEETFSVTLSDPEHATLKTDGTVATGTITDDDTRGVTVKPTELTIAEGESEPYTVELTTEPTGDVTVSVQVPAGTDVSVDKPTLTFTSTTWTTAQTVTVSADDDADALTDGKVTLTHTVSGGDYGANGVTADPVAVTIVETDTPTLGLSDVRESEAVGEMVFSVTLSRASSNAVLVEYATADGTAQADSDYTEAAGTLTFAAETTQGQEIRVPILDDTIDEAEEESFTVTLSGATNAALAGGGTTLSVTGTIADNDDPAVTVAYAQGSYTATEGGTAATVKVRLSGDPERTVIVPLTHKPDAGTGAADYAGVPGSVTFASGETEQTYVLTATDDAVDEDDETVSLGLGTLPARVTPGVESTASVTLIDDDERGVKVSETDLDIAEGGEATYTVVLKSQPTDEVTVTPQRNSGDADVTVSEALTFTTSNWETAKTVTVRAAQDDDADDDEATIGNAVSGGDYGSVTAGEVSVTVNDDETEMPSLTLTLPSPDNTDGDGTGDVTLSDVLTYTATATNSGNVPLTDVAVSGLWAADGKECASLDLNETCVLSGTHTVTQAEVDAGKVSATATATATGVDEQTANLDTPVQQVHALTLTITAAPTSFVMVGEQITYSYTVTNSGTVTLSGTVTITDDKATGITCGAVPAGGLGPGGAVSCAGSYTTEQADLNAEGVTSTATATLDEVTSEAAMAEVSWSASQDADPLLSIGSVGGSEDVGSLEFTVDLSPASLQTVTVGYATADGTASAGTDYTEQSGGRLTFAPGTTVRTIAVAIAADDVDEEEETFSVTLSDPEHATLKTDGTVATGTITDDDTRGVTVKPTELTIAAGESAAYAVVLTTEPSDDVTVSVQVPAGTDVSVDKPTLTFTSTTWTTAQTVTVSAADDADALTDGKVTLTHAVSGGDYGANGVTADPVETTVETDTPTLGLSDVRESEAVGEMVFSVTLSQASGNEVLVEYATADGTAQADSDYTGAAGTLTFAAETTQGQEIRVPILDDTIDEAEEESFTVTLSGATNAALAGGGTTLSVTGTIADNDDPAVTGTDDDAETPTPPQTASIAAAEVTVVEGRPARFTVTRTGDVAEPLTVTVGVTQRGSFIAGVPPTRVRFEAHAATATLLVPTEDDTTDEPDGAVTASLGTGGGYVTVDPASATVRVTDNDAPPELTIADAHAAESAGVMEFTVELSGASSRQVTVHYATEAGTATEDADYTRTVGTLTFEPGGALRHRIAVPIVNDALDEADSETFTVAMSGATNATAGAAATGTIVDDDAVPALTIADVRVVESAGAMEFTVRLAAASGRQVTVACVSEDGTATAGEDYVPEIGTLVLEPGQTTGIISVPILDDRLDEVDETFTMVLSDPVNATLEDGAATGTIIDDDASLAGMWLSRFGRTVATHELEAVGARLSRESGREPQVTIAGQRLERAGGGVAAVEPDLFAPSPARTMDVLELLAGSSFLLTGTGGDESAAVAGSRAGARWSAWGRGGATQFAGKDSEVSLQGTVVTGTLGVDYQRGPVLAGVAVSHSAGGGEFTVPAIDDRPGRQMKADSSLTSVHPYVRLAANERLAFWGLLGYGRGRMALSGEDVETGIEMKMGAFGASGALLAPAQGAGFGLDLKSDGFLVLMASEPTADLPVVEADASRVRLVLDGSLGVTLGAAGVLTPSFEVGVRHDGGDAETGIGLEVGGGASYVYPPWGLTLEANGRLLITHRDRGYEEWGAGGSLRVDPGTPGRGLTFGVNSSWGTAASGVERLWALQDASGLANDRAVATAAAGRLDAELGYGLGARDGMVTPYAGLTLDEGGNRAYRLGSRVSIGPSVSLSLEADRRERVAVHGVVPDMGVTFSGTVRW